jgi:hypothetical protein
VTPTPSKAKEFAFVTAFKEVCDFEILISEIVRCPAPYDHSLKEYSDEGLKEILCGKVCEVVVWF